MVVPHPGFRRKVAEHVGLLLILSSHHSIRRSKHCDRNLFPRFFRILLGVVLCVFPALAVRDAASATEGTVKKIDAITKTIVVKTASGTEHTIHFLDRTAVHGAEVSAK